MTNISEFPTPVWADRADGSALFVSRNGAPLALIHPIEEGGWSFATPAFRGTSSSKDGAKASAEQFLRSDDPLSGLNDEHRELIDSIMAHYSRLPLSERADFLSDCAAAIGVEMKTNVIALFEPDSHTP